MSRSACYNDGAAFRYVVPPSPPLTEILFRNEFTEFRFARDGEVATSNQ